MNVIAAAERIAEGEGPDLYSLREADYDETLAELVKLRGIADKVANCVMLFALDKPQAFPVDVWIVKAMRDWYPDAPVPPALNSNGNKTTPTERTSERCGSGHWSGSESTQGTRTSICFTTSGGWICQRSRE